MATSGNQKVSHSAEPSNQIAAIGAVVPPTQAGYPPTYTPVAAPGTLDSLFNDGTDLPAYQEYRGLYIGVAGNIKFNDHDGNTVGPIAVPQGVLPFRVRRIWSTGTSVTSVLGLR
jgi:hypothetical protein